MKRKKYHLPARLKKRELRAKAAENIAILATRLRGGWNPWVDTEGAQTKYITIDDACERYVQSLEKQLRRKSILSYTSRLEIFRGWLQSLPVAPMYVYQIDREIVVSFLDYIFLDRDNGPRTRNNYLGWLCSFCSFLVERKWLSENPASGIGKIKETAKKRQPLTHDMLREMADYLRERDPYFLLGCYCQYFCLIRPSEMVRIRVGWISVREQSILVPADVSKNKRDGKVAIPDVMLRLMVDLGVLNAPTDSFLFSKNFRPGARQMGPDIFNKAWKKLRKALRWSDEYQFYSLKDSGIRDIANATGVVAARNQARHTDISTTNKYLQGRDALIPEEMKRFGGAVGDID